jgi:hypothetical protein
MNKMAVVLAILLAGCSWSNRPDCVFGLRSDGCASGPQVTGMDAKLTALIGHSIADVVVGHGPATSSTDLGGNKRVFQWENTTQTPGAVAPVGGMLVAVPSQQQKCLISLVAVSNKPSPSLSDWIVESYRWIGACPG